MPLEHSAEPGDIYLRDGAVYRVVGYQPSPTVILERLIGPEETAPGDQITETHAVGCLNAERFTRLKPVTP